MIPSLKDGRLKLAATFDGEPVAGAQVIVAKPADDDFESTTDENGHATLEVSDSGVYSVRIRHIEQAAGELDGKKYPETRHYCTIALNVSESGSPVAANGLQNLPRPVTSFGAAISAGSLYMYGGHMGTAHSYSKEEQSNELTRLDLSTGQWSSIDDGPHLQGLAMVAYEGSLYRIGGFTALNAEDEEHDLQSQSTVACYDPAGESWLEMPSLPEPRSSHDAAVVGDSIYVVGGWQMLDGETTWHSTAWTLDLSAENPVWKAIADPPFQRRALALAGYNRRLFVIGGMQNGRGPTTDVAVYNPENDSWSEGPALTPHEGDGENDLGRRMLGFGASAFATGGSLYVSTVQGTLQRLSGDGQSWDILATDLTPRFFHRLLPLDDHHLIAVGGANMQIGKFEEVDIIDVRRGT